MDASSVAGADCLLADRWQYIPASVALPDRLSSSKESRLRNEREKRVNNDKKCLIRMLLLFIAMQWPLFDLETLLETTWVNTAPSPDRTKGFHETLFNSDLSHHVLIPFCVALQCCLLFLLLFFRV